MRKLFFYILLIASAILYTSCNNDQSSENVDLPRNESLQAKDLSLQALQLLQQGENSVATLQKAGALFKQSIEVDSANYGAYNNLVNVYLELGYVDSAYHVIQVLNEKASHPDYVLFQGFIEERNMQDIATATASYKQAKNDYEAQINEGAKEPYLYLNYAIATFMVNGKDSANAVLKKYESVLQQSLVFENIQLLIDAEDRVGLLNQLY